eukprot:6191963-Pleurochrysis_carterae.AAC.3
MLLMTARLSLAALCSQLPRSYWQMIYTICPSLLVAGRDWTQELGSFTSEFRPKPATAALPHIGAVMFDDYTRRVLYQSLRTSDSGGFLLNMTNSCSMHVSTHER